MNGSIARPDPASWTRIYWPVALALAVAGFVATPTAYRGYALAAGTALIVIPEITVLVLHRPQDTFSDWAWHVLDVTRHQNLDQWSASHFLALLAYVAIVARVLLYLWFHQSYWWASSATIVAIWLLRHLFWGIWR